MPAFDFEGLDIGTDDSAVDAAFAKALGRETDTPEPTDEVTPGEEPAAEEEQEGQPRNALGQFAGTTTEPEGEELEQAPPAQEIEATGDPVIDEYLSKYGGDREAAIKAAAHQASLLGRQADEVGQLRQELAQLREQVSQPSQPQQQQFPITEQVVEDLTNLAMQDGHAALQRVGQLGDPTGQLTEHVLDIWFSVNPRQASAFQASLIARQTEERVRAELQPVLETHTASAEDQAAIEAWSIASSSRADLNELAPALKDVFEARPGLARAAANAESPQELADLYLVAADIAAAQAAPATSQVAKVAEQQQQQELTQSKKQAAIVRPSAVGSEPGTTTETPDEVQRIKQGIEKAAGTSILDGWTTG